MSINFKRKRDIKAVCMCHLSNITREGVMLYSNIVRPHAYDQTTAVTMLQYNITTSSVILLLYNSSTTV